MTLRGPGQPTLRRSPLLTVLVLLSMGTGAHGQAAETVHREAIRVELVNVEVRVTDRKGLPVSDLGEEDFELLVDGETVEISNFSLIENGQSVSAGVKDEDVLPEVEVGDQKTEEISRPREDPFWLVIYFDQLQMRQADRTRLMRRIRQFLGRSVGPETEIMIASYDRSLRVQQGFTVDRDAIASALDAVEESPVTGARFQARRWDLLQVIDSANFSIDAVNAIKPYVESVGNDLDLSLNGLDSLLDLVAGLPGRREILYVASGLPRVLGGDLFLAIEHKFADGQGLYQIWNHDWTPRFQSLGSAASGRGVTLNLLDAAGIRASSAADTENTGLDTPQMQAMLDMDLNSNVQEPLRMLAESTGGVAILNQNNPLSALEKMIRGVETFYSLGFQAESVGDDEYHRIEVRVRHPKVSVRHREGYVDRSVGSKVGDRLRASLVHSFEENPLAVDLTVGELSASGTGRFVVPLEISIPVDRLALVSGAAGLVGRVRVFLVVMDGRGRMSEVAESTQPIELPEPEAKATAVRLWSYIHRMIIGDGEHRLAVGVRDDTSGLVTYLNRNIEPVDPG